MPRTMVTMSGTSREHEKRLLRGVMVEALEAQQRKRAGLEEQLERAEAAPLLNSDDEKAAKAHAKALRRAAQVPVRLSEVDAAEAKLAELQTKLRSGGDVAEVCDRPHRVSNAHAKERSAHSHRTHHGLPRRRFVSDSSSISALPSGLPPSTWRLWRSASGAVRLLLCASYMHRHTHGWWGMASAPLCLTLALNPRPHPHLRPRPRPPILTVTLLTMARACGLRWPRAREPSGRAHPSGAAVLQRRPPPPRQ